jgi:hypothetical protein
MPRNTSEPLSSTRGILKTTVSTSKTINDQRKGGARTSAHQNEHVIAVERGVPHKIWIAGCCGVICKRDAGRRLIFMLFGRHGKMKGGGYQAVEANDDKLHGYMA